MNNLPEQEQHRSLRILTELSGNDTLTQRDLSNRLGIALGLVNSYLKNLLAKGFIRVKSVPPRRYAYFLTPNGFAEKTRLTYDLLQDYTRIYREARANLKGLFTELGSNGVKSVVFAGADEVAEIAFLTLQETNLVLSGVVDLGMARREFFGNEVRPVKDIGVMLFDCIVITSYLKREALYHELLLNKADKKDIKVIFPIS